MFLQLLLLLWLLMVLSSENFGSSLPYSVMAGICPGSISMICVGLVYDTNTGKDYTGDGGEEFLPRCFKFKIRFYEFVSVPYVFSVELKTSL